MRNEYEERMNFGGFFFGDGKMGFVFFLFLMFEMDGLKERVRFGLLKV